jgi:hypothetical protein
MVLARGSAVLVGLVGALIAACLFLVTPPARAATVAPYPPPTCSLLSVSTTFANPGDSITVSGADFVPGSTVSIVIVSPRTVLATTKVSSTGTFSVAVTVPDLPPGNYQITATANQLACPVNTLTISLGTSPTSGSSGGHTPANTGVDVLLLIGIGGVLFAAGLVANRAGRRRVHGAHRA